MSNERSVEIPWAVKHAEAPVLDVGCAESIYLDQLPDPITGIDLRPCASRHPHFHRIGDIRTWETDERFQTVLAISTLEHIGLECRAYGTVADDYHDGDRAALLACHSLLADDGKLLVSVPFGGDYHYEWFRQYDTEGLKRFLDGLDYEYVVYAKGDPWFVVEPELVEDFQYDHAGCSARAVALITVAK